MRRLWRFLNTPLGAGLLVAFVASTGFLECVGAWPSRALRWCYSWLTRVLLSRYTLSGWMILLIFVGGLLAVPAFLAALAVLGHVERAPEYQGYTKDVFLGALWQWRWESGEIILYAPLCPQCQHELLPEVGLVGAGGMKLRCEHCGYSVPVDARNVHDLEERIGREIRRKVRTGEWKEGVADVDSEA